MMPARSSTLVAEATKQCRLCWTVKSVNEFEKGRNQCKECRKTLHQERIKQRADDVWPCNRCHLDKTASDFHPGVRVCKDCTNGAIRNRRRNNPVWAEKSREQGRRAYAKNPGPARRNSRKRWAQTLRQCVSCEEEKTQEGFVRNRTICKTCFESPVRKCRSCGRDKPSEDFLQQRCDLRCKECRNAAALDWQAQNPERVKEIQKKHHSTPEFRAKANLSKEEQYARDSKIRNKAIERNLLRIFGLTIEEYELKKREQGGRCASCGCGGELVLDHNHATNQVREFLCSGCNTGIGKFREDIRLLSAAIEYLNQPGTAPQEVPSILVKGLFARFEIPHWEGQSRDKKFRANKNQGLKRRYQIIIDQYEGLLAARNGVCWICRQPQTTKRAKAKYVDSLHVDHCHDTDMIRGLLCNGCNTGIGFLKHDIKRLEAAIKYIERWNSPALDAVLAQANESKREAK